MNIRRVFTNLFRSREDAELARRAIAEREEERRQSQERMREQVAQLLEEVHTSSWRYVSSRVSIPLDNPIFSGNIVRTIQNGNNQIFEIDLNKLPDSDNVSVDSKNKMRKIFGSEDV